MGRHAYGTSDSPKEHGNDKTSGTTQLHYLQMFFLPRSFYAESSTVVPSITVKKQELLAVLLGLPEGGLGARLFHKS